MDQIKCPIEMALIYINLNNQCKLYDLSNNSLEFSLSRTLCLPSSLNEQNDCDLKDDIKTPLPPDPNLTVKSVVDWSEFYVSELKDTVLAKIESLKQHFKEKTELSVIVED